MVNDARHAIAHALAGEAVVGLFFAASDRALHVVTQCIWTNHYRTRLWRIGVRNDQLVEPSQVLDLNLRASDHGEYLVSPDQARVAFLCKRGEQVSLHVVTLASGEHRVLSKRVLGRLGEHGFRPRTFAWIGPADLVWVECVKPRPERVMVMTEPELDVVAEKRWRSRVVRGRIGGVCETVELPEAGLPTAVVPTGLAQQVMVELEHEPYVKFQSDRRSHVTLDLRTGRLEPIDDPPLQVLDLQTSEGIWWRRRGYLHRIDARGRACESRAIPDRLKGQVVAWAPAAQRLWAIQRTRHTRQLICGSVVGGTQEPRPVPDSQCLRHVAFDPEQGLVAWSCRTLERVEQVWVRPLEPRSTKGSAWPVPRAVAAWPARWLTCSLSSDQPAWSVLALHPRDIAQPVPVVIYLQGGPDPLKDDPSLFEGGNLPWQALLQNGVAIATLDYPVLLDDQRCIATELLVAALRSTVDKMAEATPVDVERLAIVGHSWGAMLAAEALCHTTMFRAAVLHEGFYDCRYDQCRHDAAIVRLQRRLWGGAYFEAPEVYAALSPALRAHQVRTPVLIQAGAHTVDQARLYATPLWLKDVPCRLEVYRHQPHRFEAPQAIHQASRSQFQWLMAHLAEARQDR